MSFTAKNCGSAHILKAQLAHTDGEILVVKSHERGITAVNLALVVKTAQGFTLQAIVHIGCRSIVAALAFDENLRLGNTLIHTDLVRVETLACHLQLKIQDKTLPQRENFLELIADKSQGVAFQSKIEKIILVALLIERDGKLNIGVNL